MVKEYTSNELRNMVNETVKFLITEDADSRARHRTENFLRNGRIGADWERTYGRYGISLDDQAFNPMTRQPLLTREGRPQTFLQFIERQIRNQYFHGGADIRFEAGVARILVDDLQWQTHQQNNQGMSMLRKIILLISKQYNEDYDNDLNGLSFDELIDQFGDIITDDNYRQQEEAESYEYENQGKYNIERIESFDDARMFARYTYPQSEWCICDQEVFWDAYTNEGEYTVYFAYVDDFDSIRPNPNSFEATDEYGMSLLCIIVDESNDVVYSICRYNEAKDGSDMMWNYAELSKILGGPVKQLCPYIPSDESGDAQERYRQMAQNIDVDDMMNNLHNTIHGNE